jgi:hypothetical protein
MRPSATLHVESLELREVPSVTLAQGVLRVEGSRGNDRFTFVDNGNTISVLNQTFARAELTQIVVEGRGGYDVIRYQVPGADQRLLWYGLFTEERSAMRSQLGQMSVSVAVNLAVVTDAYFSFRTELAGRRAGGFIVDVGDPAMMLPPRPGMHLDDDADEYAEIVRRNEEDHFQARASRRRPASPPPLVSQPKPLGSPRKR